MDLQRGLTLTAAGLTLTALIGWPVRSADSEGAAGRAATALYVVTIGAITVCVAALLLL